MRTCPVCGKSAKRAASRSHSNIRVWRRQRVNLQKVGGRVMCARCLKTEAKKRVDKKTVSQLLNAARTFFEQNS